jgi:hypothetical protein
MRLLLAAVAMLGIVSVLGLMGLLSGGAIAVKNVTPLNVTQHSYLLLNGYMDETKIYQTQAGFKGQKLVVGTRGSGFVSRRQTIDEWTEENGDSGLSFNEWGYFEYKPYNPGTSESDLKNALCAKNYKVGSVFSESYTNIRQLIKDTDIYQDQNVSVYLVNSELSGTAKLGSRYKPGPGKVTAMINGGVYVGEVKIHEETEVGHNPPLVLPCV